MVTNVLYTSGKGNAIRDESIRLLNDNHIVFHVIELAAEDPECGDNVRLVSSLGEFSGLEELRFYAGAFKDLQELATRQVFATLAEKWQSETKYSSTVREKVSHPAYRQILKMGKAALPLILERLQREPDHWFWALTDITQENPVTESIRGNVPAITNAWIEWGKRKGYLR